MRRRAKIVDPRIDRARQEIAAWRRRRRGLGPMPAPLWQAAVTLAREYGATRVAKQLGIGHTGLRTRLAAPPSPAPTSPTFVELAVLSTPVENRVNTLVALMRGDGRGVVSG